MLSSVEPVDLLSDAIHRVNQLQTLQLLYLRLFDLLISYHGQSFNVLVADEVKILHRFFKGEVDSFDLFVVEGGNLTL